MNSIMKKISCLVLGVCLLASATANNISYSKKVKGVVSIEQINASKEERKAPVSNETIVESDAKIISDRALKLQNYAEMGLARAIADTDFPTTINTRNTGLTVMMVDAYGDGWNGNSLCVGTDNCVTLDTGSEGTADLGEFADGTYAVTCGGGSWGSEVSWAIYAGEAVVLDGGCPFTGELVLGDAPPPVECEFSEYSVSVGGGSWDSEVSWSLSDGSGGGAGEFTLCLADGDYDLTMNDSYGDGWNGATWVISTTEGSLYTFQLDGINDDGSTATVTFSLPGEVDTTVYGCMLEGAPNYNADAEVDDGSCEYFVGANFGYWNPAYSEYYLGCGTYYIFADCVDADGFATPCAEGEADGIPGAIGNGTCDDIGDVNTDGISEGLACDYFGCDGGDCLDCNGDCAGDAVVDCAGECGGSAVEDECGVCEGDGTSCDCDFHTLNMFDSYGDGWNGNQFCINDNCATIETGSEGTATFCVDLSVENTVTCDGGSYQSEVSWSLVEDATGAETLAGGAPFIGCLGDCSAADVYGCTNESSSNYNADATIDDGSCLAYPGAPAYPYWTTDSYYDGWMFDCGAYYIWPDADGDGMADEVGNGACSSADYNYDGILDGFACEFFACEGGDCSDCSGECLGSDQGSECWDGSFQCDIADCPEECDTPVTLNMYDSYGDGWNGAIYTVLTAAGDLVGTGTLAEGEFGFATLCMPDGDYLVTIGGGSWDSEITWDMVDSDGNLFAGGAVGEFEVTVGAPPVEIPDAPSDLVVTGVMDPVNGPSLAMTWTPVEGADAYSIYIWDDTPAVDCEGSWSACVESLQGTEYYEACSAEDCSGGPGGECDGNVVPGLTTECGDMAALVGSGECPDPCPYQPTPCDESGGNGIWVSDGYCDAVNNTEACEFDGGDCCPGDCVSTDLYDCAQWGGSCDDCIDPSSADLAEGGQCFDDGGPACAEGELLVTMTDSYGDGWNGNVLTIGDATFTIEAGASAEGCYAGPSDVTVTCDGGLWQAEVSWSISDESTGDVLLEGGAPFSGCLGTCDDGGTDDACADCMSFCVGYVMENYGYTEEEAVSWCSTTPDAGYGCADTCADDGPGDECADTEYTVLMGDSYGDGWNGNQLCVDSDCVTLDTGTEGTATLCIADGPHLVTCGGGSWGSEVSWSIEGVISGGAPFEEEVIFGSGGDVASNHPIEKTPVVGSFDHKMSLLKKHTNVTSFDQLNHRTYTNSDVDREGWVLLGTTVHYSEFPADYLTIFGFAYGETALLGVSSVNIAGESDIASAEGTTPDMDTPYNLQASDAGDGVVSLTWEYDGFEPAAYPDCLGNVSWIGDGWCDASNNNPDCDFDGGDCCADSCDGSDDLYSCDECDTDGDGVGCGDQADADGDGIWDSCADPDFGGEYEEPEDCVELNATGTAYAGDPNGCYDDGTGALSNALEFAFEDNCGVTSIQYGTDPGELTELTGGPFFGSFFFYGFGPSETYFFILGTADGVYSDLFEATTSDYECAGDAPEPSACGDAGGNDSWLGDGYCDAVNNVEACGYDSGDCCPGDCVDGPSYSCEDVGGTCATCVDPSSADLAEGGQCYDDGSGPEPILVFTLDGMMDDGASGSAAFTIPEGCDAQNLIVDGGSWQSEVSWTITAFDTPDIVAEGGAPFDGTFALPAGTHAFNGFDAYGDGWNGNVATMTCAPAGVAAMDNRTYRFDYSLSNGSGLYVVQATDTYKPKPIVIDHNVDRAVTSFNVYDSNTGENVGVAFDLAFSLPSDGGCWVVTAFDDALGLESGASNEACFSGCSTAGTGDSNGDGLLNVLDVVIIVGEILEPTWDGESCDTATADMNGDGVVNVLDIVIIVGEILEGRTVDANSATIYKADNGVSIEADGFVAGVEIKISHDSDFSIELTNDAMVAKHVTKDNTTHLIVVAPEDDVIFTSNGNFTIDEVIAANTNGEYINITNGLPTVFGLSAAYPNPFNPVTNMELSLVNEGVVSMNVYNVSGQLVDVLVDGVLDAGYHNITWDAANIASGVYFVKVISGSNVSMQKVMLLK